MNFEDLDEALGTGILEEKQGEVRVFG